MKIYKIPKNLKTIIFDIDSTLYTNEAYATEQVDIQLRHFAKIKNTTPENIRKMIEEGKSAAEIKASWADDVEKFKRQRRPYLLYQE